jgi:hypothetical protein
MANGLLAPYSDYLKQTRREIERYGRETREAALPTLEQRGILTDPISAEVVDKPILEKQQELYGRAVGEVGLESARAEETRALEELRNRYAMERLGRKLSAQREATSAQAREARKTREFQAAEAEKDRQLRIAEYEAQLEAASEQGSLLGDVLGFAGDLLGGDLGVELFNELFGGDSEEAIADSIRTSYTGGMNPLRLYDYPTQI